MKRSQLSGAEKRKISEDKKQKFSKLSEKIPKLTSFFKVNPSQSSCSKDSQDATIDDLDSNSRQCTPVQETIVNSSQVENTSVDSDVTQEHIPTKNNRESDAGAWHNFSADDVEFWIECGPNECQYHNGPFLNSLRTFNSGKQNRFCSANIFIGKKANGENYTREWLLYSPSKGSVYCFVCKLFVRNGNQFSEGGFSDWRNPNVVEHHENSQPHRDSMLSYLIRRKRVPLSGKLDKQIEEERKYWQHVLQRVVAVIQTLAERGLPFRGSNEIFGSLQNGNFLGSLELVSKFDPFLATHISKYGNSGTGNPSYLSKTICDELIHLMSDKVRSTIVEEVKAAKYFSLSVDSTPDLSHTDQLSVVLRYLSLADGKPIERFLTFLNLKSHTGEEMAKQVLQYLMDDCKLDFSKCRGQSYDNAANMSGHYKGMQQKVLEENQYAIFVPCAAHSLNLVGRYAVDSCQVAVNFFSTLQILYNFFSVSTHRWQVLKTCIGDEKVLKSLSKTRWEAHAVATDAVMKSYSNILDALETIDSDKSQKGETIREVEIIMNNMQEFEFVFMLVLWNEILQHFHNTSKALQQQELDMQTCSRLYQSLTDHMQNLRNEFVRFEDLAKNILPDTGYKDVRSRRRIRKKQVNDGSEPETVFNARDKFLVSTFYVIIDALKAQMMRRSEVYHQISSMFSFLNNMDLSDEQYKQSCDNLVASYPDDLNVHLFNELRQFHCYIRSNFADTGKIKFSHFELHETIVKDGIESVFQNVETALRIFLTLMITNCSAERSFSQLKRLKNPNRTTISDDRLDSLSLLCIEADMLRKLTFDEIIKIFAADKCRKKVF